MDREHDPHGIAMDDFGHVDHMGRIIGQDAESVRLSCFEVWDFQLYGKTTESGHMVTVPLASCQIFQDRDSMLQGVYRIRMNEIEEQLPF